MRKGERKEGRKKGHVQINGRIHKNESKKRKVRSKIIKGRREGYMRK